MHSKTDIQWLHTQSLFGNACRFKVAIWKKVTCLHHWADLEGDLTNLRTLNTQYIAYFPTSSKKIATTCKNMKFKKLCGFYAWIMLRRTGYRNICVCVCVCWFFIKKKCNGLQVPKLDQITHASWFNSIHMAITADDKIRR